MSFWIGGAPKEDQKAKVRTLVRLGFGPDPAIIGELATLDPHRTRNATVVARTPLRVLVYDVVTYRSLAEHADLRERLTPYRAAA